MIPGISIEFQNGNLGTVVPSPDGCFGLVVNAVAVGSTFELYKAYVLKGMSSVASLGIIDSIDNHRLYKALKEFYAEAGEGTELWLMGVDRSLAMSAVFTLDGSGTAPLDILTNSANGKLRGVLQVFNPLSTYTPTIVDGLDQEVVATISAAQLYAENYTAVKYAPFFVIIEGYAFTGDVTDVPDLLLRSDNRVGVLIGDTETRTGTTASNGSAIGVIGGRLAKNQVQVNIGRVRDGEVKASTIYYLDAKAELFDIASLHDKGYITFRTHQAKSGYFFTDDPLATEIADDYHYLSRRRVVDKAYRIAYVTGLNYLLDNEILNNDGTISPFYASSMEAHIEREIATQMTANGELSSDQTNKDDLGCRVVIDKTANVASTSNLPAVIHLKPVGYNRWLTFQLGFALNI